MSNKKQSRREDIIAIANRLVYTKGFNQTSFADIADELGITKGNLHYHFNSKNELLQAIITFR
ncbi:MAG: TetR/AcrR family transcriptional regulator, partial [Gammaproteobacteria bacterium]|nr:TetR/AcrR family transcriptional regulator [Gammaproteobacteria bacterium]